MESLIPEELKRKEKEDFHMRLVLIVLVGLAVTMIVMACKHLCNLKGKAKERREQLKTERKEQKEKEKKERKEQKKMEKKEINS